LIQSRQTCERVVPDPAKIIISHTGCNLPGGYGVMRGDRTRILCGHTTRSDGHSA